MDHDCDTNKRLLHEGKPVLRRWSNCFGLVNRFRRLKNRLSLAQTNTGDSQQNAKENHVYPGHHCTHHSATTIATDSRYLSSNETIEHDNRSATAAYHLSISNTPTSSLSPPPRHSYHHIGRVDYTLHEIPEYCQRKCRPLNNSTSCRLQKMTLRLSLDTESCHQQHYTNDSDHSIAGSPPDVNSLTDSLDIYRGGDGGSTLNGESNFSAISNHSSLVLDALRSRPRPSPCRSGTLGHHKTIKDEVGPPPPLPSASISTSSSLSCSSNFTSIDLPLKERRRRRSPLMFADSDKLTLPIPRNDITKHNNRNTNTNENNSTTRLNGLGTSSLTASVTQSLTPNDDDYDSIMKSRERAMQRLEGNQKAHGKVVSMARIAPTKLLDEQLVMEMKTDDDDDEEDASSPSYTVQQRATLANQTGSLLTPSAAATALQSPSSNNNKTAAVPTFLPTPSSLPPPAHHSPPLYLPSTPNSMDSSYL